MPIARALSWVFRSLKVFSFGPRPYDFLACNAPIKPLFDLGVNIQENSELDLLAAFNAHEDDPRIAEVAGRRHGQRAGQRQSLTPAYCRRLAQYEITLLDWAEANKGAAEVRRLCQQVLAGLPDASSASCPAMSTAA